METHLNSEEDDISEDDLLRLKRGYENVFTATP
jgi:hypothetical protein